jgi:tetratricopeptide (TPR) repeat protein
MSDGDAQQASKQRVAEPMLARQGGSAPAVHLAVALLVVAGAGVYANSFYGAFVFDDQDAIVGNRHIRQLWPPLHAMSSPRRSTISGRPAVAYSVALNYQISALGTWSYHAVNLAIHLGAALLLFGIVRRTLSGPKLAGRFGSASLALATSVALLWTVHPLQTESVTYIVQRAESLYGLMALMTLYCAIRAFASASPGGWERAAMFACACGMACKEAMVTMPLLVLLYERIFLASSFREIFARRWRFHAALAATWMIVLLLATGAPRGTSVGFADKKINAWTYLMTQARAIVTYLRLSFWPDALVLDYGWPLAGSLREVLPQAIAVVVLLCATGLALRYRPALGFLGAAFFLLLAPSSSFVPIITEVMAEHRMYLPLATVVTAVVIGGYLCLRRLAEVVAGAPGRARRRAVMYAGVLAVAVAAVALAVRTVRRNEDYRTPGSVWRSVLAHCPDNPRAHNNLAAYLIRKEEFDAAIRHLDQAISIESGNAWAHGNLALALSRKGRYEAAMPHYHEAIRLDPNCFDAYANLAMVYEKIGRRDLAISTIEKALERPDFATDQGHVQWLKKKLQWLRANRTESPARPRAWP